ncbi:GlxA family transcriptional regulator [Paraburkholderia strydomiana]|uniref:GlxA family transcriptional regulator n=1 Tax=Paraburkholderia strydomiana TaxID=1245417 RepID=UPI001BEAE77F|nr:GlxA family transcriptional regulator [Paraburkholderia strydomiana]MBT2794273.1 GlxA family transcriptional regulator [Paraburkholderia strydomiana]
MKVAIVVFDGFQALDVAGASDVFAEANANLAEHQRYEVSLVGEEAGALTCSNGMQLWVPSAHADSPDKFDLILVAGGLRLPDLRPSGECLKWLQNQAKDASRFGSVGNGAFVLGHAGLLDGRRVTTHWSDANRLSDDFPRARVSADRIFIRDGRLFTCAGVTACMVLCLSLVAEDWGNDIAVRVANRLVVSTHREGRQLQYCPFIGGGNDENPLIGKVREYLTEHITDAVSMEQLANAVSVSRRTFSRLVAKYASVTPSAFVERVRVERARTLLETSDAPLKTVAFQCGFHNASQMRTTFARRLDLTPKQYRQQFRV